MCHCNPDRVRNLLTLLPVDELKDIRDKGPFPVEINCHYCSTPYQFTQEDVVGIYAKRHPNI
jgi:molecular chaperone Hsp33